MHTIFTIDEEDVTCGIVTIGSRLMLDVLIRHIPGLVVQTSGSRYSVLGGSTQPGT